MDSQFRTAFLDMSYIGLYPAISAAGGFVIEEGLQTITLNPVQQIGQYDLTLAIQVKMDVRAFNAKIGLYKDASNINIISTAFDMSTNKFPIDSITITADEFVAGVTQTSQIVSVGKYNTLYSDFITYINDYFNYANGFSTLFNLSSVVDINGGVFDASAFIHIINENTYDPDTGTYVKDLSGSIQILQINQILNYIVYANSFQNRGTEISSKHGFIAGDLIFVPEGLTAILNLYIHNNSIVLNHLGVTHTLQITNASNYVNGYFSSSTTNTETNIRRIVKAPLLIILANLS